MHNKGLRFKHLPDWMTVVTYFTFVARSFKEITPRTTSLYYLVLAVPNRKEWKKQTCQRAHKLRILHLLKTVRTIEHSNHKGELRTTITNTALSTAGNGIEASSRRADRCTLHSLSSYFMRLRSRCSWVSLSCRICR